jgi:hypothetical protein
VGETPLHLAGVFLSIAAWHPSAVTAPSAVSVGAAGIKCEPEIIKMLIEAGADVNARATGPDSLEMTPLTCAGLFLRGLSAAI